MIVRIYWGCSTSIYVPCSSLDSFIFSLVEAEKIKFFIVYIFVMSKKIIFLIARYDFLYKKRFSAMKERTLPRQHVPIQKKLRNSFFPLNTWEETCIGDALIIVSKYLTGFR